MGWAACATQFTLVWGVQPYWLTLSRFWSRGSLMPEPQNLQSSCLIGASRLTPSRISERARHASAADCGRSMLDVWLMWSLSCACNISLYRPVQSNTRSRIDLLGAPLKLELKDVRWKTRSSLRAARQPPSGWLGCVGLLSCEDEERPETGHFFLTSPCRTSSAKITRSICQYIARERKQQ